jgi:hypothetical protein
MECCRRNLWNIVAAVSNVFKGLDGVSWQPGIDNGVQLENILCIEQEADTLHPPCFVSAFRPQQLQRLLDVVLEEVRAARLDEAWVRAHGVGVERQRWVRYDFEGCHEDEPWDSPD